MPTQQDFEDRQYTYDPTSITEDDLGSWANFPIARWREQESRYREYRRWYTGEVWEEKDTRRQSATDQPLWLFPLKINGLKTLCEKHVQTLWGEAPDTADPLVSFSATPVPELGTDDVSEKRKRQAQTVEQLLDTVWYHSNGRAMLDEASVVSEYLGGAVFQVRWSGIPEHPWSPRQMFSGTCPYGIQVEYIIPDFFLPIWSSANPWHLLEAFVVYKLPAREAAWRFEVARDDLPPYAVYIEHWTPDTITIKVGDKPVAWTVNGVRTIYDEAPNPFGFVPFVYIPHLRSGGFYGESHVPDIEGILKEYNARMADLGDAINETSHRETFVKNVASQLRQMTLIGGRRVTDLGRAAPGSPEPDLWNEDPPSFSAGLTGFPADVWMQFMRAAHLSPVAFGEDEGSQRSALTLAFRMWPLTAHTRRVRTYWTTGFIHIARMILAMAIQKGIAGITEEHVTNVRLSVNWPPQVPRDREQEVNEAVLLMQSSALSPGTALKNLRVTDDEEAEVQRVLQFKTEVAKIDAEYAVKGQDSGASTQIQAPVATSFTGDD